MPNNINRPDVLDTISKFTKSIHKQQSTGDRVAAHMGDVNRELKVSDELLKTRLALAREKGQGVRRGSRTGEIPELQKAQADTRFIGIRQPNGKIGVQDLSGADRIMTAKDFAKPEVSNAMTAQVQRTLQMGRDLRTRHREEEKQSYIERNGQAAYDKMQSRAREISQENMRNFAKREAQKPMSFEKAKGLMTTAKTPEEKELARKAMIAVSQKGENNPYLSDRQNERMQIIRNQERKDFEAWDRGDPGSSKGGVPQSTPMGTEKFYTKDELGGIDPAIADKVSAKLGYDIASTRERTARVNSQVERAERMAQERAAKKPLFAESYSRKNLRRESVERYKQQLNENLKLNENVAAALYRYITRPGGIAKITDPIVDAAKWVGGKLGLRNTPGVARVGRRTKEVLRGVGRAGVVGGIGYIGASQFMGDSTNVSPYSSGGAAGGGGGRFNPNSGISSRQNSRERMRERMRSERMASYAARRERKALIKTQMAETGQSYKKAVRELEKNLDFNKLTAQATRFQTSPPSYGSQMAQADQAREQRRAKVAATAAYRQDYVVQPREVQQRGGKAAYDAGQAAIVSKWDQESGRAAERASVEKVYADRKQEDDANIEAMKTYKYDGDDVPVTTQERDRLKAYLDARRAQAQQAEIEKRGVQPNAGFKVSVPPPTQSATQKVADEMPVKQKSAAPAPRGTPGGPLEGTRPDGSKFVIPSKPPRRPPYRSPEERAAPKTPIEQAQELPPHV